MRAAIRRFRRVVDEGSRQLLDGEQLQATLDRLVADGELAEQRAAHLRVRLDDALPRSQYVLRHLGAHLGIAAVFAFDVIPLPLGTLSRVLWVIGNRAYESIHGTPERARIHSIGVLLFAAIPLLGYGAYLIPLRRVSEEVAYLYANHVAYARRGRSLTSLLETKPRAVKTAVGWLIPVDLPSAEVARHAVGSHP